MPGVSVHTIPGRRRIAHVRQCGRLQPSVAMTTDGNGSVMPGSDPIRGAWTQSDAPGFQGQGKSSRSQDTSQSRRQRR